MVFEYLKRSCRSLSGLHWVVVGLSLALTVFAWSISSRIAEEKANQQFAHQVTQITEQLKDRMANYAFALLSGTAAIRSQSHGMTWSEWRTYSQSLALPERLPGINGIGVIFRVAPDKLDGFIADQRLSRPDFRVHPDHQIDDYWPITYIEPEASNRAAIGLDMAHEANRYAAAVKAMNTATTQITGPIVLVQDAAKTPGFLFFQPFYRTSEIPPEAEREAGFQGLVYAPFIMYKLMDGTLANVNRRVQLRISDGGTVLYDELNPQADNYDASPMFASSMVIPMYGRQWHLDIQTTQLFQTLNESRQPTLILSAGLTIDSLILLAFMLFARARDKAEALAAQKTGDFENEAKKLKAVLNTVSEAVITADHRGFITSMNPSARQLFGASRNGQPIVSLFADSFVQQIIREEATSDTNGSGNFDTLGYNASHETFPAHVAVEKAQLAGSKLFTYTVRDLSAEKAADLAKSQFVSTVSHELRTPLTAIAGATALLENQLGNTLDEAPGRMLDIIQRNTERLNLLVSDLLDIEGFTSGSIRLSRQPNDLADIARKAIRDCTPYASSFNVTLAFEDRAAERMVMADRDRIGQVVLNLVSNAIKFSPAGSRVRIETADGDNQTVCIRVIDRGEGIPESYRQRAFGRFSQVDSSDVKSKAGTGLGLSICKAIIELHDGVIDYQSTLGEGSTFYFCLPLHPQP